MHLFLEPIDVWLFRDGRPFTATDDHRAESLFPPYPSVVQGAIRSKELVLQKVDLRDKAAVATAVGTATDYKALVIRGPFVARREGGQVVRYFPQPADAVTVDANRLTLRPAKPPREPDGAHLASSSALPQMMGLGEEPKKGRFGLWLAQGELERYLTLRTYDGSTFATGIPSARLFERESRFGIARDNSQGTVKEGFLYEVEYIRPVRDVGLLLEVEGYAGWPDTGLLRLGGEGHGAKYQKVKDSEIAAWPTLPTSLPSRFKVYFATPTYFRDGWQPQGGDWIRFFRGQVRLVSAAIPRYESLGGYDLTRGGNDGHKPARRYVPAGAVYYFETTGQAQLQHSTIADDGLDQIGYGQIIIKEW